MIEVVYSDLELDVKPPIMGQERYLKAKSDQYGWFQSESFVIPFILHKIVIFTRMVFMSEVLSRKEGVSIDDEEIFLNEVVDYIREHKMCDFIYKAQSNVVFNVCPKGAICVPWGTYIADIDMPEDDLLMSFQPKARQKVRKAIKTDVKIEITEDTELVYNHIKKTLERQKSIHYPSLEYLQKLEKNLGENSKFFIAIHNGEVQGCVNVVYDGERAFSVYGGSHPRPVSGALNLMYYEIFKYLHQRGVKTFDFVGTRLSFQENSKFRGIAKFKESFSPRILEGYAFRLTINPVKYFLFDMVSKLYLRFKGYTYMEPIDRIVNENQE